MSLETSANIPDHVSKCIQLAVLLEVSAYPKPGNVHRTADFQETGYEHFLASSVALAPHLSCAAEKGVEIFIKEIALSQIEIGKIIKNATADVMAWQHGGNTLLGSIVLLVPMAAAAGLTLAKNHHFSIMELRTKLKSVVEFTTPEDAANVYDAINLAQPGGLGKAPQLDVTDERSRKEIIERSISLYEVFKISSSWDSVSAEWVTNYHITYDIAYPFFKRQVKETNDVNTATVHTYLKVLSEVPDTLIVRKAGASKAKWVSAEAKRILETGGLTTDKGRSGVLNLDRRLHDCRHRLNPGTTADITSATLALATLNGYRP